LIVYLFNPLPEAGTKEVIQTFQNSLREFPRPGYVLYVNPAYEQTAFGSSGFEKIGGTHQYSLFRSVQSHSSQNQNRA